MPQLGYVPVHVQRTGIQLADSAARQDLAAALAIPLPRAASVVGMADQHRTNCRRAGLPGA